MTEITSTWMFDYQDYPAAGAMVSVYSPEAKAFVSVPQLYRFDLYHPKDLKTWVGQFDTREEAEAAMKEDGALGRWEIVMVDYTGDLEDVGYGVYQIGEATP